MVSCQKGPTHHAYAWQIGPFWQDTLNIWFSWSVYVAHILCISQALPTWAPPVPCGVLYLHQPSVSDRALGSGLDTNY